MNPTHRGLLRRALVYVGAAALLLGLLFFGTAGTFAYWEAWLYLAILFIPMSFFMVYLVRRDPDLLERRLRSRESRARQRSITGGFSLVILLSFVIPGLDQRFGWSSVPAGVVIAAAVVVELGYGLFFMVLRENSYAGRTVTVDSGQQVVKTGPYRLVRHPMYLGITLLYLASPVALGSYWALLPALLLPFVIVARIRDEERMLADGLPGYSEYMTRTRYRLVPGVW
jgi:protein-S-isoprenylcysteine O-methyltransferase Ste14